MSLPLFKLDFWSSVPSMCQPFMDGRLCLALGLLCSDVVKRSNLYFFLASGFGLIRKPSPARRL